MASVETAMETTLGRNKHFWTQTLFSGVGIVFSAGMLMIGKDPSVYLPIFTSILFAWLPSPMSMSSSSKPNATLADLSLLSPPATRARRQPADNASNV